MRLLTLIIKLNQLTGTPLRIELNEERKAQIAKQLTDLDTMDTLSDEVAEERLNALLAIVKDDLPTLEKTGFSTTGGGGFGSQARERNPFVLAAYRAELHSMQERVGIKPGPE
jgi:hypothetical protein